MFAAAFAFSAVLGLSVVHAQEATSTPDTTPTCTESQHLDGNVCVDNAPAPEIATSTSADGTGGQHDVGGDITTGDATASTSISNELNSNNANVAQDCTGEEGEVCDEPGGKTNSSTIVASTTNEANLASQSTTTATSGDNVAEGGQGTSTVKTGDATATANVINLVNTNIFNSTGLILFLNQLFGTGLDLRNFNLSYFFDGEAGASPTVSDNGTPQCTLLTCLNASQLNVVNDNTATVTNSVIVRAATGENIASSTGEGDASIDTGDAYAAANVVNVVNTNIINSSYLMVSFNNFGDLAGNITLPNADFFSKLFAHGGSAPTMNSSSYDVNANNNVDFEGTTTAQANTGSNEASTTGTGHGDVETGQAYSAATSFTDANSTYFGGTSAFFFFRVAGEWTGQVRGLPAGLSWTRLFDVSPDNSTSTIILVTSDNSGVDLPEAEDANCDKKDGPVANCYNSSSFLATSTNTAVVENNIDVSADTGNNETHTKDGTGTISTGAAYAVANVLNLINTNIVGRNWIFAVFNILGNWSGDISFGSSDLSLEASTDAIPPVLPGMNVAYHFTIKNNGDLDADNVVLKANFDKSLLSFTDGSGTDTGRAWNIGSVGRGKSKEVTYTAKVGDVPAGTSITIPLTATIEGASGNGAQVSFTVATVQAVSPALASSGGGGGSSNSKTVSKQVDIPDTSLKNPEVTVVKTSSIASTTPAKINYKVVITNAKNAGPLYQARLDDTLYNPDGSVKYTRAWDLHTLAPGDQINLTYTVEFSASTTPGTYRNVASVTGLRLGATEALGGKAIDPVEGSRSVTFSSSGGIVLGADSDLCSLVPSAYLTRGSSNTGEVIKLQKFLNAAVSANLPPLGIFGPLTETAVKTFQNKYKGEVLTPLGLSYATGSVYGSTLRKMQEVGCGSAVPVTSYGAPQTQTASAYTAPTPVAKKDPVPAPAPQAPAVPVVVQTNTPSQSGGGVFGWFSSWFK